MTGYMIYVMLKMKGEKMKEISFKEKWERARRTNRKVLVETWQVGNRIYKAWVFPSGKILGTYTERENNKEE